MTKSNAILELEVLDLTDKIAFIQQSLNSTQSQLLVVEKKLSHETAHSLHLEQKLKDTEALLNTEIESQLQEIAKLQNTIESLKETNERLEASRESLELDLATMNMKCQNLEDSLSKSTSKSIELSKLLAEERILNTTNESTRQLLDTQLTDLHDRLKTFQRQATSETLRLTEQLSDNQESIIPLQTRIATLEQELTASNTLNLTLTSKNQTLESESITLHTRIQDLEGWTLTLQEELDSLKSKTILSTPPTPTPKQPTRHRITSLKTLFARPQAHSLTADPEPSSIVISPTHIRKPSDATSLSSHVTRQSDPSLSDLTPLFTPSTPTTGLLKLPKDGKPRHGWRAYNATLDASHFVLSDQRNSGDSTGTVVIDIREADVFRVCSVSQNELIHVSGRVIECVFKVLVGAGRSSVGSEKEAGQSFVEASKALEDVKGDIGKEEAVLSALEKMIGVVGADEGQKHMVCVQIETSRQKLEKLGVEEQRLLGVLETLKSEDPNLSLDQLSDQSFQEDLTQAVSLLQTKLDEEIRKRETLKKLVIVRQNQESASATTPSKGKSIKDEITASEMAIQKLETDLSVLTGTGPRETKKSIVKKVLSSNTTRGGHVFKRRQNYQSHQPMACANCQDALWGNQSLECTRKY
ncbi:hypothetical protein BCR33DRAFT_466907 [Rhizoclosmatium globosum]|uniref:MRCK/ROCK kinase PH domain-containing protein n=1 Tax=Rhizoclosmatium globosum TaxID=329046 RepID=A0A1Y2BR84_9FUNG|nr:hypothetical protein BCR33DRAFT_466907 [Rhizoclosmatium globosum]|eukprot:ORY37256.1 hypothetical protein BCR33DRAFT_466907 [Rhizoclosmatium globosum]